MKVAIILAGCGAQDGSEIHESTLLLYALSSAGVEYDIFAPNREQADVMNFIEGNTMAEKRNVLVESARIARGAIRQITALDVNLYDGLMLPGGFGAAKNLFTFAFDGIEFSIKEDILKIVNDFHSQGKVIGAMCIAPLMIAKALGRYGVEVTLGAESDLCAAAREAFGAKISTCAPDGVVVDIENKIITTPAYMYGDNSVAGVGAGAQALVAEAIKLMAL
ncbi:MAG: isoprenoid biosynthesis glyoxalase ElbB [Rikenellaceae bacterium]